MEKNVCILGNDKRMDYIAEYIYNVGYEISRDIEAVNSESIIILPPPVNEKVTIKLIPYLNEGQTVYGGMLSNRMVHECGLRNIKAFDYLKVDSLTEKNAELTAKGIVKEALANSAVIENSSCLLIGYGFCGKAIARELAEYNASVDIMVRRESLKNEIMEAGFGYVPLNGYDKVCMEKYSYVFNTVPALILDDRLLSRLSHNVMIFDIASAPGGCDFEYCRENNIFAILSLGIPGKEYPMEAGRIIADVILNDLNQG